MKSRDFRSYRLRYRRAIQQVLAQAEPGRLDEAAFPAYSHRNPLIKWLFWQRLRKTMEYIERRGPYEHVLDFGCGSGVMLPYLSEISTRVTAVDIDLLPLERVRAHIPLALNVEVKDGTAMGTVERAPQQFDLIIALDVLEHVGDLPPTLAGLFATLKPGGRLIVSGPTENVFYRLGRKLAGREYSGAYHDRDIAEIEREVRRNARAVRVETIATLCWAFPLFKIFAVIAS